MFSRTSRQDIYKPSYALREDSSSTRSESRPSTRESSAASLHLVVQVVHDRYVISEKVRALLKGLFGEGNFRAQVAIREIPQFMHELTSFAVEA